MGFLRRHRLGLAIGGTVAAAAVVATTAIADPSATAVTQEDLDAMRSKVSSTAALATIRDGESIVDVASGTGKAGEKDLPNGDDQFRAGSDTKMMVATVVLQLVEEGKLALDDPIAKHLPGVVKGENIDENKITIRHLLQHTSGLGDNMAIEIMLDPTLQWNPPTLEQMVEIGMQHGSAFEPGTNYLYSNTGYSVLGLMVQNITGRPIADDFNERIIQPLGMEETSFPNPGDKEMQGDHVHGYLGVDPLLFEVSGHEPGIWSTAAGIVSSGSDMTTFTDALVRGDLLGDEMMKEMQTTYTTPEGEDTGYGLGLARMDLECGPVWGHNGHVLGYMNFTVADGNGRSAFTGINTTALDQQVYKDQAAVVLNKAICGAESKDMTVDDGTNAENEAAEEAADAKIEEEKKAKD